SSFVNGSPGFVDNGIDLNILRITEVLAYTDGAEQIEIFNATDNPLDLGGWFISNDPAELARYQIPAGTTLSAGGYLVLTGNEHFGGQFNLADGGGTVTIASPDATGDIAGFVLSQPYAATQLNQSQGVITTSDAQQYFVPLQASTFGEPNSAAWVGDVVIGEISYAPTDGDAYIELQNRTDTDLQLGTPAEPALTWNVTGSVQFSIPAGTVVSANGRLLIVATDPAEFRTVHGVPADVAVLGPFAGTFGNEAGDILLTQPSTSSPTAHLVVDRVHYLATAPWPLEPATGLASMIREPLAGFGSDPANWLTGRAPGTPGTANLPADVTPPTIPNSIVWSAASGPAVRLSWTAATDDETGVMAYRVYRDGVELSEVSGTEFVDSTVSLPSHYDYQVSAVNSQGIESPLSEHTLAGLLAIESVASRFANQIDVTFSSELDRDGAELITNYQVPGVQILAARLASNQRTVVLTTSELVLDDVHELIVSDLVGVDGSVLPPAYVQLFSYREGVPGITVEGIKFTTQTMRSLAD
ncbi:MAG: lamin tail domain-containing protein, partial [Planctomycetales bacterium]|nr:lamin tail domain-containing protein [Planctomycetales bacterium]